MSTRTISKKYFLLLLPLLLWGSYVAAQQGPGGTPPPEATAACASKTAGAACSFTGMGGAQVSGACTTTPQATLACRPDAEVTTSVEPADLEAQKLEALLALLRELLAVLLGLEVHTPEPEEDHAHNPDGSHPVRAHGEGPTDTHYESGDAQTLTGYTLPDSDFYSSYEINDSKYGTEVAVTISGTNRTITANALPNHDTGTFPNSGNPNRITEQSNTYSFPATGTYTGTATFSREPGVAVNGVKFEPNTAETVECTTGERYQIEALQETYNLGFDENDAHVQPDGTYHYHGYPSELIAAYDTGAELIHIGFAEDGHMIYADTTGSLQPSWQLKDEERVGNSCSYRNNTIAIDGTTPDGTYVQDWKYVSGSGDLDACNGAYIDGTYAYFVTDTYPFVGRCTQH